MKPNCTRPQLRILSTKNTTFTYFKNNFAETDFVLTSVKSLLHDKTFADFKFIVEGKEFEVHKVILAGSSEYFKLLFTVEMAEKKANECKVPKVKAKVFELLLEYIYTRKVTELADHAIDLYDLANCYQVEGLKVICKSDVSRKLRSKINSNYALKAYEFAVKYGLQDMISESWTIIKQ
jgi:hypothetical protein